MNKGRRNELARLKHKKRCKVFGIKPEENYCYRSQGKPCSCFICTSPRYDRVEFKEYTKEYIEENRSSAYDYVL